LKRRINTDIPASPVLFPVPETKVSVPVAVKISSRICQRFFTFYRKHAECEIQVGKLSNVTNKLLKLRNDHRDQPLVS